MDQGRSQRAQGSFEGAHPCRENRQDDQALGRSPATESIASWARPRPSPLTADAPRGLLFVRRAERQPSAAMAEAEPKMQCFLSQGSDRALGHPGDFHDRGARLRMILELFEIGLGPFAAFASRLSYFSGLGCLSRLLGCFSFFQVNRSKLMNDS